MEVIYNNTITFNMIPGSIDICKNQEEIYSVKRGDVLFNRTSETEEEIGLAAPYQSNESAVFGGFVIRARPMRNKINDNFKSYCFRSSVVRSQIIKRGQGAVRTNIGQRDLGKVQIPLPPLSEQKRIAACLSTWDKAIEVTEKLITQKEKQK